MKKIYLILVMMLSLASAYSADTVLNNYLEEAAKNNPALKAKFNEYLAALEKVPQVSSLPDPKLTFGYFISPVETRTGPQSFSLSLAQMYPWFGQLDYQGRVASEMAKAKLEQFRDLKYRLFSDVKKLWYRLYELDQKIRLTKDNIFIVESFKELATVKFEAGKASMVDIIRTDLELDELNNNLKYLEDSKEPLFAKFRQLLNNRKAEIEIATTIDAESISISKEAAYDSIIASNPKLRKLDYESKSWENKSIAAEKAGYPNITFGLNYVNINPRTDLNPARNGADAVMPMLGISLPIYRGKYDAAVQEATINQQVVADTRIDLENKLKADFEGYYRDYADAVRRVDLYKSQLILAGQALNLLVTAYSTDGKDFEEILRIERKILYYQLQLEEAMADRNVYVADINYLMGR